MTDLRNFNKQFLIEFIELYRSHPCLWKIKSAEYSDRDKKNKAYEDMTIKLQEIDNSATKESVKKKIDSLRGCFRKELKKVIQSKKSGSGTEEVYKPHLWYYEYLLFLTDQETPRSTVTNIDETSSNEDGTSYTPVESPSSAFENTEVSGFTDRSLSACSNTPSVRSLQSSTKKRRIQDRADEVLEKVNAKLDIDKKEDNFDVIGKNVANKLRELPRDVALMTEKFISDVLFEAALGNISRNTKMFLDQRVHQRPDHQNQQINNPSVQADLDYGRNYGNTSNPLPSPKPISQNEVRRRPDHQNQQFDDPSLQADLYYGRNYRNDTSNPLPSLTAKYLLENFSPDLTSL